MSAYPSLWNGVISFMGLGTWPKLEWDISRAPGVSGAAVSLESPWRAVGLCSVQLFLFFSYDMCKCKKKPPFALLYSSGWMEVLGILFHTLAENFYFLNSGEKRDVEDFWQVAMMTAVSYFFFFFSAPTGRLESWLKVSGERMLNIELFWKVCTSFLDTCHIMIYTDLLFWWSGQGLSLKTFSLLIYFSCFSHQNSSVQTAKMFHISSQSQNGQAKEKGCVQQVGITVLSSFMRKSGKCICAQWTEQGNPLPLKCTFTNIKVSGIFKINELIKPFRWDKYFSFVFYLRSSNRGIKCDSCPSWSRQIISDPVDKSGWFRCHWLRGGMETFVRKRPLLCPVWNRGQEPV